MKDQRTLTDSPPLVPAKGATRTAALRFLGLTPAGTTAILTGGGEVTDLVEALPGLRRNASCSIES